MSDTEGHSKGWTGRGTAGWNRGFRRLMLWLCLQGMALLAAPVTMNLERDTVPPGQSTTLQIIFENCRPDADPTIPSVPNLTIQFGGTSSQINMVNGQVSQLLTYSYVITPLKEGEYQVPSFVLRVGGQAMGTQPLKLHATKNGQPDISKVVFLKWEIPRTNLYVGETLPVELRLYVQQMNGGEPPQYEMNGLTVGKLGQPQQGRVQYDGRVYQVLAFRTYLMASRPGPLTLGPTTMRVNIPKPGAPRRRANWPFDDAFFGGGVEYQTVAVQADAIALNGKSVPTTNQPPNFSGAIGLFNVAVSAGPTNIAVGDPVTLKVEVTGNAFLDTITLPSIDSWKEFKIYPPTSKVENADAQGLGGRKFFEQVVVPQSTELKELPVFQFSFFDPESQTFRTALGPRIPLIVRPSATAQPMVMAETATNTVDILPIKPQLGALAPIQPPLVFRPWFLGLQTLPVLAWLGFWLRRRQLDNLANNPRLRRRLEVNKIITAGLAQLPTLAEQKKSEDFFALVFRLLQERLGERLDLPASAITEAVIEERLRPLGLPPELLKELETIFQTCNQARYAPLRSAHEYQAVVTTLAKALTDIESALAPANGKPPTLALLLLALLPAVSAGAADARSEFDAANKLYEQGRYSAAVSAYRNLLTNGQAAPALYFNLGNAAYKAGQTGRAIEAYRQAELLDPRDPDIRGNLLFVRKAVTGKEDAGPKGVTALLQRLTLNEWAILVMIPFWVWVGLLAAQQAMPQWRRQVRSYTLGSGLLFLAALAGLLVATSAQREDNDAIVMGRDVQARQGPFEESKAAFALPDGSEVTITGTKDNWLNVRDVAQRAGWIKQEQAIRFKSLSAK
ncbi:MAG: BatD family protein [Verrucomicrobiota bacterium]